MWTLLMAAGAFAQTPIQEFDAALGWQGDALVWRSHTDGWFAPDGPDWSGDTGMDPCAHVYDMMPDPEITCSEVHITDVQGSFGFTVAVTAFDSDPAFCGQVDWKGLIDVLPRDLTTGGDGLDGPDGVQIVLVQPDGEGGSKLASRGEDGWTVTRGDRDDLVDVEVRRAGVAFSFLREWAAGGEHPDSGFTTLYAHWSPNGRHVALMWTDGSGDGFGDRFQSVSANVVPVRPLIQVLAHPDLGPETADHVAADLMNHGPVATGPAKKARETTVVYAAEAFMDDAKQLAPGLAQTATVEPLTWESPADLVVAVGSDFR